MLEGEISHDRITRFLSKGVYDSRTLWQQVKPMVSKIEPPDGALIFDDTIEEKPHTDEDEIVSWHFNHSKNRTLKGINILNCVYPVAAPSWTIISGSGLLSCSASWTTKPIDRAVPTLRET